MTKRFSTPIATLAIAAVLTLAGCSAGSLTGPEAEQQLRAPQSSPVINVERGPIQRNAPHNDDITRSEEGGSTTKAPIEHNELPDDEE